MITLTGSVVAGQGDELKHDLSGDKYVENFSSVYHFCSRRADPCF